MRRSESGGTAGMGAPVKRGCGALRKWFGCIALLAAAVGGPASAASAECDGPHATILAPVVHTPGDARAYWLDAAHVRWPGQPVGGRYRLVVSARGTLTAVRGQPVAGADAGIALYAAPVPTAAATRFAFTGEGADLAIPAASRAGVADWLRGQVLLVREDARGNVVDATYLQVPGALDDRYAAAASDPRPLGATPRTAGSEFRLWAPTATRVALCLERASASGGPMDAPKAMVRDADTGLWTLQADGDLRGLSYRYLVEVFVPGVGMVRNRVTDPYAVTLDADSARSVVADLDDASLKPAGWDAAARPPVLAANTDLSIYELHVRDFSAGDASVPAAHRGKYLAFTAPDSAGMRHLRALREAGITDIHLLPVFDLATVPERGCVTPVIPRAGADAQAQQAAAMAAASSDCFNWGYDPLHYNAPEGSYASDAGDGAVRVREFRAMVMALHAAGLRVGMDVVYNHTSAAGQEARSVLDRIVPGYYQRLDANGAVATSTCCANTATEHAMMARLMRDSVASWARHYRIDSFRFDLMGHQPRDAMRGVQRAADAAAGRHVQLLGEGWNFGEIADGARFPQAAQGVLNGTGIATFSDRARDALRGGGCCDGGDALIANQGLLNGLWYAPNGHARDQSTRRDLLHAADLARAGLAGTLRDYRTTLADGRVAPLAALDYKGMEAGYASQPGEVVNYVENHDNPTLWDIHALKLPQATPSSDRARVQLLGAAFVAFSQGIAYYHAGMDVLRSKSLDRNSYDSGDWFNRLDWTYTDNGFAAGLPPARDNGKDWPLLRPVLRNPHARPAPADIAWMRDAFRDLLRIRAGTPLLRLRTAAEVQQRLRFRNVGPRQNPRVVVGHLDGRGIDPRFDEVLYLINVSPTQQSLVLPEEVGKAYVLHPVQASPAAADARARGARYAPGDGRFEVPGRSAVVFVINKGAATP